MSWWKTRYMRDRVRPERANARTVFSKDGGSELPATSPTSARCSSMPVENASRKCPALSAEKSGRP